VFRRSITAATVVIAIVSLGVGANAWLDSVREPDPPGAVGSAANIIQDNRNERIEAEVITLTPRGFEPREITRPTGPFLLAATNRSSLEEVVLRLERIGGNRMQELRLSGKRRDWQETLNLPAGEYILSEATNPDWICQITIRAE